MAALMNTLSCKGCGASLAYAAGQQALKCDFCSAITEIARAENELEDTPDMVIPLTVEQRALEHAVFHHLASGQYTPDDLVEYAVLSKVERFYVPAYDFSGKFEAQWTASFGYDRRESYTQYESRTENGRTRQVPVTKTRTVTDWTPVNGTDAGSFAVLGYSGAPLAPEVMDLVEQTHGYANLTEFKVSFVSGFDSQPFAVSERDTYSTRALPQINSIVESSVMRHAQGDRQRDWHWTANIDKQAFSVLVPLCHVVVEYEGKQYNVWTDGADTGRLVADPLPTDAKRKSLVYLGFAPGAATSCSILLAGLCSDGLFSAMSQGTLAMTATAWGYGFWRRHQILKHSALSRQSMLARRTASQTNLATLGEQEGAELAAAFQAPGRSWVLDAKKDKRALAAFGLLLSAAIFMATFWHRGPSTVEAAAQVPPAVTTEASVPPEQPAPAPAPAPAEAQAEAPVESPPAAPAAPEQPAAPDAAAATAAPVPQPEAASASTSAAAPVAAPDASQKTQLLIGMLQAAVKGDWPAVDEASGRLKQSAAVAAGNRAASKAANDQGLAALRQHDYPNAVRAFSDAARADAANVEARNNLGFAYLRTGDAASAINVLTDLLQVVPDRAAAWLNIAEGLALSGKAGPADASLRLALHFASDRSRALQALNRIAESRAGDQFGESAARVAKDGAAIPQKP